jgi:hypothetical protein
MFKRPAHTKASDQLADRVRRIAAEPVPEMAYLVAPSEKRDPRQLTFKPATITLAGGERMDVVVKDASTSGVRIEFFRKVTLSDQIMISEATLRIRTWTRVIWQTAGAAGLMFLDQ